jgi:23S rRNA (guanosine2251-2'-O)-methyltransferase
MGRSRSKGDARGKKNSGGAGGLSSRQRPERKGQRPEGKRQRPDGKPRPPERRSQKAAPNFGDQLEGRNVVLAAMEASKRVKELWVDQRAKPDAKLSGILALARERGVTVKSVPRAELDAVSKAAVHNGLIGFAHPLPALSLKEVLDRVSEAGREPFIVLLDQVQYEQNLGAILRSAAAAGADAVVIPTRRGASMSPTVQRVAMGGAEVVPLVRESMTSATVTLARRGIRIFAAEADGDCAYWDADFSGPLALALGGEDRGVGAKVRERCDQVVAVPIDADGPVTSLNVSVTAVLLFFERIRQTR